MDSDRESERLFSLRLSRVMGDIGVNSLLIARRRKTHLRIETLKNVRSLLGDKNATEYIFGSQSEATTTPGMESDTDLLYSQNSTHVVFDWKDWHHGKSNLLVLKNELTPPQHCYLQRLKGDCPLPVVQLEGPDDVMDGEGRILVANTCNELHDWLQKTSESSEIVRHGPSMTYDKMIDHVSAYHCGQLPKECMFMFNRPRPGHWPMHCTLAKARDVGVFLVPQGYTEGPTKPSMCRSTAFLVPPKLTSYPYSNWQWRFTTSLMERHLVFEFSHVQVKTYTLAKMIRKTVFKPMFGNRFSTFHIKTVMMFTIENYPPDIWREDNIVKCVCLLLKTLKRWLKQKYCPHFTISGVNLFVGKLQIWELPKLCNIISQLINTKLQCLFNTRMDNIGLRLLKCSGLEHLSYQNVSTRNQTNGIVLHELLHKEISIFRVHIDDMITDISVDDSLSHLFILQSLFDYPSDLKQEVVSLLTPFLCSTLASMLASRCIYLGQPISQDIFKLYQLSFDLDLMSSRLKFASMLFCRGQYDEAATVLTYCEGLLGPEMFQCCAHYGRISLKPGTEFRNKLIDLSNTEVVHKHTMLCITFSKEEINCIPQHLQFEMILNMEAEEILTFYRWKNNVVTDCIPFLYYLQYITYRELHMPRIAQTALHNLLEYTTGPPQGHIDTAFNMLAHCFELENRLDLAWMYYNRSLEIYDRDNVSIWHAARILQQCLH
ncbi:uncharacterized protein LOC128209360 [Mya arenaria]|uniref:uncharacterized protein LOC128209360 n=1 Tax=Mya arenaria TaxID=6604 RepID=UPI0022E34B9E|nr:uncharacterized protein LOC128209360 [Mya arenaria]